METIFGQKKLSEKPKDYEKKYRFSEFKIFNKRVNGHEYSVSHFENSFYIITNKDNAKNFKLMKSSLNKTNKENWENVIDHRKNVLLEGIEIFNDYLVVVERDSGLVKMNIKK